MKLREAVRGGHDLVGRLGGEEFGILLAGVDAAEAFRVAERARALIRGLSIDGFSLDCSAGVAAWPTDTDTPHRLLDLADAALYQAKRRGRGQTRRVDADSGEAAVDQQRAAVRRLLDEPELVTPVFQPIVVLATGRVAGYEGLSRFPEADGRRPDEWFDLARRCGMGPLLQALALRRMVEVPGPPEPHVAVAEPRRGRARHRRRAGRAARGPLGHRHRGHRAGAAAGRRGAPADARRPARPRREDRAGRRRRRLRRAPARGPHPAGHHQARPQPRARGRSRRRAARADRVLRGVLLADGGGRCARRGSRPTRSSRCSSTLASISARATASAAPARRGRAPLPRPAASARQPRPSAARTLVQNSYSGSSAPPMVRAGGDGTTPQGPPRGLREDTG